MGREKDRREVREGKEKKMEGTKGKKRKVYKRSSSKSATIVPAYLVLQVSQHSIRSAHNNVRFFHQCCSGK